MTPSHCWVNPGSEDMPSQHGAEMPEDRQQFVEINVVKSSAMKKTEKRPGLAHILNKPRHFKPAWLCADDRFPSSYRVHS